DGSSDSHCRTGWRAAAVPGSNGHRDLDALPDSARGRGLARRVHLKCKLAGMGGGSAANCYAACDIDSVGVRGESPRTRIAGTLPYMAACRTRNHATRTQGL